MPVHMFLSMSSKTITQASIGLFLCNVPLRTDQQHACESKSDENGEFGDQRHGRWLAELYACSGLENQEIAHYSTAP